MRMSMRMTVRASTDLSSGAEAGASFMPESESHDT